MKRWYSLLPVCLALPVWACDTPVFEYALTRWPADDYEIIVFHRGGAGAGAPLAHLRAAGGAANLAVRESDLAQGKLYTELLDAQPAASLPWMVVRYPAWEEPSADAGPADLAARRVAWAGPADTNAAAAWLDSSARRELVRQLVAGRAVVWILLESGDRAQDDAAVAPLLSPALLRSGDTRAGGDGLSCATLRVSRRDPQERALTAMLTGMSPGAAERSGEPMVFPAFGRARVLPPLIGAAITTQSLAHVAAFLSGPCACEVKDENPGADLLVAADWEKLLAGRPPRQDDFPPLISLSQLAALAGSSNAAAPAGRPSPTLPDALLRRNLAMVCGAGLALVAGIALWLRRGKGAP
jgi:hypothetical protein